MAILFKKTAVILFLLSHHVFASSSPPSSGSGQVAGKKRASEPAASSYGLRDRRKLKKPGEARTVSPLGVNEICSPPSDDSSSAGNVAVSAAAETSDGHRLSHHLSEWDSFDFLGLNEKGPHEGVQAVSEDLFIESVIQAVKEGDLLQIKDLFRRYPAIIIKINDLSASLDGLSPVMLAVLSENRPMVDFLIGTGQVDPNSCSATGTDLIYMVIERFGDAGLVRQLLMAGSVKLSPEITFNIADYLRILGSPMFGPVVSAIISTGQRNIVLGLFVLAKEAVFQDDVPTVRLLASYGIPTYPKLRNGTYFIHYAAVRGNTEMVNLLLQFGTPIDVLSGPLNISALQIAYYDRNYDLALNLISKGARAGLGEVIKCSIDDGVFPIFSDLVLSSGELSRAFLPGGYNVITYCISTDRPECLSLCLNRGDSFDVSAPDQEGRSIRTVELPENCSEHLRTLVESVRDQSVDQFDLDDILEFLSEE